MPSKPPNPDSWVNRQPGGASSEEMSDRVDAVRRHFEQMAGEDHARERKDRMLPLLLIRTEAGDHGTRPRTGVFWESPDIWVASGDPSITPALPPSPGGTVVVGQPTTVYAHVWNCLLYTSDAADE